MQLTADQQTRLSTLCRQYHVARLRLFGSAATGEERPDSDVDVLVDFLPGATPSAFALVDLRDALSRLFGGRKVDLAFESILHNPYRRRAIEPQLRPLYSAPAAAA